MFKKKEIQLIYFFKCSIKKRQRWEEVLVIDIIDETAAVESVHPEKRE